jgi:hypothetical protein
VNVKTSRQPDAFAAVTFRSCTAAFTWRIWRGHRASLIALPFVYFGLIVGMTVLAAVNPRAINGARGMAANAVQFGVHPGHLAIAVGAAFFLVPVLVALQLSRMAANAVRALIGQDRSLGSMELLCASPASRRILLAGILTAPLLVTALDWLILTVLLAGAAVLAQATLHIDLSGHIGSLAELLVAPLPLGALGGALVLAMAVLRPRLTDQQVGPGGNVLRLVSAAPALLVIALIFLFGQQWGEANIVIGTAVAAVLGYMMVIGLLSRFFHPEKILI